MSDNSSSIPLFMGGAGLLGSGDMIRRYRIQKPLGKGGMGLTFLVRHELKNVDEVLKLVNPAHADAAGKEAFLREIRTLAKLAPDPAYAEVVDADEVQIDGTAFTYLVMKYVPDSRTLDAHVARHQPTDRQRLELFAKVCEAVQVLHEKNPTLVHRDLKPPNILVTSDGTVKIIDFGVAVWPMRGLDDPRPTTCGTKGFSSPEQSEFGAAVTQRSDIYSLGAILEWLMLGRRMPPPLQRIIARATQRLPERRFAHACSGPPSESLGGAVMALLTHRSPDTGEARTADSALGRIDPNAPTAELPTTHDQSINAEPPRTIRAERVCSAGYRSRRWNWIAAALLASTFVQLALVDPVLKWSPLGEWFERTVLPANPLAGLRSQLSSVRLIAITDETEAKFREAKRDDLAEVILPVNESHRWDHTELLRQLQGQGSNAVVFDMLHPEKWSTLPPTRREALKSLLDQMDAQGTPVIMGGDWRDSRDRADRPGYWIATASANVDPDFGTILIDLAAEPKDGGEVTPSLAMLGVLFAQFPGTRPQFTWSHPANALGVRLHKVGAGTAVRSAGTLSLKVSGESVWDDPETDIGLKLGDKLGYAEIIGLAPQEALRDSTIDYADVALGSPANVKGRIALVIDTRSACKDKQPVGREGVVPGGHLLASGIEALVLGRWLRGPDEWDTAWIMLSAALLPALLAVGYAALRPGCKHWEVGAAVTLGVLVVVSLCLISSVYWLFRINPFLPAIAALLSGICVVVLLAWSSRWIREYGVMT